MLITCVLVAVLAISVVLGGPAVSQPQMELVYEDVDVQKKEQQVTAAVGIVQSDKATDASGDSRSSNLKYVTVLQKSSMWGEIKQKILTIKTPEDGKMIEKQPETLSDQELKQLKQACHDGLKCVAVDQLIVLKAVKESSNDDGKTASVLTAITKICKVITDYTTEYHEDTYQYTKVTEADDASKVYQSVTIIIEDNRELCRIDAVSDESSKTDGVKANDSKTVVTAPDTSKNIIYRNYGTIDFYNVNKDTVNAANINTVPSSDDASKKAVLKPVVSNAKDSPKIVNQANTVQADNSNSSSANQDKSNELVCNVDPQNSNTAHSTSSNTSNKDAESLPNQQNIDQGNNTNKNTSEDSGKIVNSTDGAPSDTNGSKTNTDTGRNSVNIENPGGLGKNYANADIASSGPSNKHEVKKGHVLKGNLNNGSLKVYNHNYGVINKGKITNSNAENGIINIGTINEGPITYRTINDHSNNKKVSELNNVNVQQFSTTVDKMYSAMLKELTKK